MTASILGGTVLATALLTASPASAAPPVPTGCTFERGLLTCVRTGDPVMEGPFDGSGADAVVDGFTAREICQVIFGRPFPTLTAFNLRGGVFSVATTTTTTQHGVSGRSPVLSSSQTRTLVGVTSTSGFCLSPPSAG